jgi:hypothetical protein
MADAAVRGHPVKEEETSCCLIRFWISKATEKTMDWDIMFKQLEVDRKAQKAALGVTRQGWVATLRQQNVKTLTAQYSGYGDSGNIEDIQLELGVSLAADIEEQLRDFLCSVAICNGAQLASRRKFCTQVWR